MRQREYNFAERIVFYALFAIGFMLMVIFMTSCSQTQHGFDYKSHAKSNAKWKHKQETNNLPKCNRH